jgi:hypothetical protein
MMLVRHPGTIRESLLSFPMGLISHPEDGLKDG